MTSKINITPLTAEHLAFAQEVRELAGWNQTDQDWLRLFDFAPQGCFLAEWYGKPAATATTTCYGRDLAWIGMLLVHPDYRRRGLATALMQRCLEYLLEEQGVRCVKLDATPDGLKVYEKLGFRVEYELWRWAGQTFSGKEAVSQKNFDAGYCQSLDRKAFGADRTALLKRLATDSFQTASQADGYGMRRAGANKQYLGPVVADTKQTGESLVRSLLQSSHPMPVFQDIPEENRTAVQLATELGLERQRPLIRMWAGRENVAGDPTLQWAIAGPETG